MDNKEENIKPKQETLETRYQTIDSKPALDKKTTIKIRIITTVVTLVVIPVLLVTWYVGAFIIALIAGANLDFCFENCYNRSDPTWWLFWPLFIIYASVITAAFFVAIRTINERLKNRNK